MSTESHRFEPDTIFQPFRLKNIEFENRILRSSVGGRTAAYNGVVTDVWKNFELKFANGGVGGIISTTFSVDPNRLSPFEYPSIAHDKFIPPLRERIAEIKKTGCKYIIQIGDPGYAAQTSLFPQEYDAASSSGGFDFLYGYTNRRVEMQTRDIEEEIQEFAQAARRVREAGADGLEITAEKGYLIHQFLNPGMNRRTDDWGGSIDKRLRLLAMIVTEVKKSAGEDFVVGVRLSAVDHNWLPIQNFMFRMPWVFPLKHHFVGNTLEETLPYAAKLKELGVDYLHIVSGYGFINPRGTPGRFPLEEIRLFYNATRHLSFKAAVRAAILNAIPAAILRPLGNIGWNYKQGINLEYADRFKQEIQLPVIANGGFQDGNVIEAALRDGKCDLISMARALIANPGLPNEFRGRRATPDLPCTFCNRCAARTATSPLGCYEPERFGNDYERMHQQILDWNTPI